MKRYVLGFCFTLSGRCFLMKKATPDWQKGLVTGLGGKIEDGEHPIEAMIREFQEEAGIVTHEKNWESLAVLAGDTGEGWEMYVFKGFVAPPVDWCAIGDLAEGDVFLATPHEVSSMDSMEQTGRWLYYVCLDQSRVNFRFHGGSDV